jgi:hypothetical protein
MVQFHYFGGGVWSGYSVRSKADTAMVNEALCAVLCHNPCCLISSTHEFGVKAAFWCNQPEPSHCSSISDPETMSLVDLWDWV